MNMWKPFDQVNYVGAKYNSELRSKLGVVCAKVDRTDNYYVIDFGSDAYVVHENNLVRFQPKDRDAATKADQEVYRRRVKKNDEE